MSEPTQLPALPAVQPKNEIEFKPFGSDDSIRLSLNVIKTYVAVPARDRKTNEELLPDERECMRFMMLCRTQRLNPFAGDSFMVPFWDSRENRHRWQLITGISAFYKRAELHPEFDGIESGVIVMDALDEVTCLEGDFIPDDGYRCVGGWATVHFKTRKFPMKKKVKLSTYQKTYGVWVTDAPGMICKVAEAQALRDAFPTLLGGIYLREEYTDIPAEVVEARDARRPDFSKSIPSSIEAVIRKPEKKTPKKAEEPDKAAPAPEVEKPSRMPQDALAGVQTPAEPPKPAVQSPASESKPSGEPSDGSFDTAEPEKPASEPATEPTSASEPAGEPDPLLAPDKNDTDGVASLKLMAAKSGVTWGQLRAWLLSKKLMKAEQKSLNELASSKIDALSRSWPTKLPEIRSIKVEAA